MSQDAREGMGEEDRPTSDAFGPWLRRQREIRQIQLQEIADRTKISVRYLKAMEQDRFELLPGAVFTRGFLREYARYVGLNPDEVVNFYLSTQEEAQEDLEAEPEVPERGGPPVLPIVLGVLLLVAVVLLGWFLVRYLSESSRTPDPPPPRAERSVSASTPGPAPAAPATTSAESRDATSPAPREPVESAARSEPPEAAANRPLTVTLDFREDCWMEARIDGDEVISQHYAQGESVQLAAESRIELLTLGNAGGVSVAINGVPYSLEATSGEVLRNVTFDLETARRLEERGR